MSKLVITTVGTSLLEKKGLEEVKGWISQKSYSDVQKIIDNNLLGLKNQKNTADKFLIDVDEKYLKNKLAFKEYTAEISSLKLMNLNHDDKVILLCSDTPDGAFCGLVNREYIKETMKISCELKIINGLEAKGSKNFGQGIKNLIGILRNLYEQHNTHDIVFNITGGYKGAIPFITIFAVNNEKDIYYLYQESELNQFTKEFIINTFNQEGKKTETTDITMLKPSPSSVKH